MPTEEQYLQRIQSLEERVAELVQQVERVTRERDAALEQLGGPRTGSAERRLQSVTPPRPGSVCGFCDGEGVYWVHDFEMVCRRCNGTGYTPGTGSGSSGLAAEP